MKIDLFSDINRDNYYVLDYDRIDSYMLKASWWSAGIFWVYAMCLYLFKPAILYPSPFSWRITTLNETIWTSAIGFFAALLITVLRTKLKNHYFYRLLVTNVLITYAYLAVYISGGSIEWHFHFFIIFALLTLYADWRLNWWALIAVSAHHEILNFLAPNWVYVYGRNDAAAIFHGLLVLFMAIISTKICEHNRQLADASRLLGSEFAK